MNPNNNDAIKQVEGNIVEPVEGEPVEGELVEGEPVEGEGVEYYDDYDDYDLDQDHGNDCSCYLCDPDGEFYENHPGRRNEHHPFVIDVIDAPISRSEKKILIDRYFKLLKKMAGVRWMTMEFIESRAVYVPNTFQRVLSQAKSFGLRIKPLYQLFRDDILRQYDMGDPYF